MAGGITLCGSLSRWAVPLGAAMHEAGYRALGLDWRYVPFEIDEAHVEAALHAMRTLGIRGFGVSMPFKRLVMPWLDRIDPIATRIGAVNTVVNEDGTLLGRNTDWIGAVRAIEEVRPIAAARALVLGAGGAARAVAFGLRETGASVALANRTEERAVQLAAELEARVVPWNARERLDDFDLVVNATSAGMSTVEASSPLPRESLRPGLTVMDIVYKPLDTELVRLARDSGCQTVNGGRMLLHQAAAQFEAYTGRAAPLAAMDAALRGHLS